MSFLSGFFRKEFRQPDLTFAADGFYPIAIMQINDVRGDLYAIADGYAGSLLEEGCTVDQMLSAQWGGVTAIGQDLRLFQNHAADFDVAFEATVKDTGQRPATDVETLVIMKYRAAASLFLSQVLADAPSEFERFLKYMVR